MKIYFDRSAVAPGNLEGGNVVVGKLPVAVISPDGKHWTAYEVQLSPSGERLDIVAAFAQARGHVLTEEAAAQAFPGIHASGQFKYRQ